jgi:hypothetical protein
MTKKDRTNAKTSGLQRSTETGTHQENEYLQPTNSSDRNKEVKKEPTVEPKAEPISWET